MLIASVIIGICLLAGVITGIVYLDIKKREKNKEVEKPHIILSVLDNAKDDEENKEYITLIAAKREKGSAVNGYETNKEFKERISKLTKKEFLALGLEINPNDKRDKSIIYAYDTKGNVNKKNYELLTRIFEK